MKYIYRIFRITTKILQGTNPLLVEREQSAWDQQYKRGYWDFLIEDGENNKNTQAITRLIKEKAVPGRKLQVLDVGCGNGAVLRYLQKLEVDVDYTGTDISKQAIDDMRAWADSSTLESVDALEYKHNGKPFDIIVMNEVLNYVPFWKVIPYYKHMTNNDTIVIISLYRAWRSTIIWLVTQRWLCVITVHKISRGNDPAYWRVKECKYK